MRILILHFRQFPSAPKTLDFIKITKPQKHYKICLKCKIATRLGLRKRKNNQFHSGPIAFFGFQGSWPNGSAASLPILPHFLDEKRRICVFRRKYVCSATGRPGLVAKSRFFTINAHVLLQVDAAHDCLASIAANGLLQVDAASDYSAPTSQLPRRNGRSSTESAAALGLAPEGATVPERRARQL